MTDIRDVILSTKNQDSDTVLNALIQEVLDKTYGTGNGPTPQEYRVAKWVNFRKWAMPDFDIYLDAQAKLASGISELEEQGQDELDDYNTARLYAITRFPEE